jgi:PEGA domain
MRRWSHYLICTFLWAAAFPLFAAEQPQLVLWPNAEQPILRFTFGKFKDMGGSVGSQRPYAIDTIAENLSKKAIGSAHFVVYVFDKKQIRISDGWMDVTNLSPGQSVKFQMTFMASGNPASLKVLSSVEQPKLITMTVNSSPQGALLKVDGTEAGATPKLIQIGPGKHQLTFSKDGFRTGVFPLEISANDVSGGTVSYELGTSQFDTIELRDGTVLTGDLDSVRGMEVVVRAGGVLQSIDRNKVKRILLVQREPAQPSDLPPPENKP